MPQNVLVRQKKPGSKAWRQWKRALSLWAPKNGKLYDPFKEWIVPVKNQRMRCFLYRDPQSNKAYLFKKNKFFVYNTDFNLILQNKTIVTTDILPVGVVPNDLQDGGLLEDF